MINVAELKDAIFANAGVVFLSGKPGTFKTAILESIASEFNCRFYPIILSHKEASDVGGYPRLVSKTNKDGNTFSVMESVPVDIFYDANNESGEYDEDQHSIIFFDEFNRCPQDVLNSAYSILNERRIGHIKFKDNVHFVTAGNLGEADGTIVNDMDTALKNRLITIEWKPGYDDWKELYAGENVHSFVMNYLDINPTDSYNFSEKRDLTLNNFASFRSWTNLSKFMKYIGVEEETSKDNVKKALTRLYGSPLAESFIGPSVAQKFRKYLTTINDINWVDILNDDETTVAGKRMNAFAAFKALDRGDKRAVLFSIPRNSFYKREFSKTNKFVAERLIKVVEDCAPEQQRAFVLALLKEVTSSDFQSQGILQEMMKSEFVRDHVKQSTRLQSKLG